MDKFGYDDFSKKINEGYSVAVDVGRSANIETARGARGLTSVGRSLFGDAVCGYLLRRRDEADELLGKAIRFLELAQSLREKPKDCARGYDEAMRAATLSCARWLSGGAYDEDLIAAARRGLATYCLRSQRFDRIEAEVLAPVMIYLREYKLVVQITQRCPWGASLNPLKARNLLPGILRVAIAADERERQEALTVLSGRIARRWISGWIVVGNYTEVAFVLCGLFHQPGGRRTAIIEDVWDLII